MSSRSRSRSKTRGRSRTRGCVMGGRARSKSRTESQQIAVTLRGVSFVPFPITQGPGYERIVKHFKHKTGKEAEYELDVEGKKGKEHYKVTFDKAGALKVQGDHGETYTPKKKEEEKKGSGEGRKKKGKSAKSKPGTRSSSTSGVGKRR